MLLGVPASASARTAPARQAPQLAVTGASLIVASSGRRLWSENGDAELPMASTTKLMTVLVTLQHVKDLGAVFTQGWWTDKLGDSEVGLVPGERMTVRDLLIGALIPSGDDAAWDLAYNVGGGSIPRFVAMMNDEARALGLRHTHYSTPTGLDTPGNYTSPNDLVRLANYDMHHFAFIRRTVALRSARIMVGDHSETITNTDTLLGAVPWIHGIKTGHTDDAGYVLVSSGTRGGMTLVGAVFGTASEAQRNANALALLEFGFSHFHVVRPLRRGQVMDRVPVAYQSRPTPVAAARGLRRVVARGDHVRIVLQVPRQLSGPKRRGAPVGHARVIIGGRVVDTVPLVLEHALPAVSMLTKVGRFVRRPSTLILLALIGAAVGLASRRRRPRTKAAGQMEER